jgi:hypothetical protein
VVTVGTSVPERAHENGNRYVKSNVPSQAEVHQHRQVRTVDGGSQHPARQSERIPDLLIAVPSSPTKSAGQTVSGRTT